MRINSMLCALVFVAPFASHAQQGVNHTWPVASDSRVRIFSPLIAEKKETGILVSATADSIVFRPTNEVGNRSLAVSDINRMEVVQGTHTRILKGAGWGLLVGGGLAAGLTAVTWQKPKNCGLCIDFGRGGDSAMAAALGGTAGLVVGALIGSFATDTWVPVRLP
ncbi:MAG: hypothetical protein ACRENK_04990 [Gemmatimonadaceae bacterium]